MQVVFTKAITKDVYKIKDKALILKITSIIDTFKQAKRLDSIKGVKKIKGKQNAFRIRIGNYRLGFYLNNNTIILARFLKRNDIYKVFP